MDIRPIIPVVNFEMKRVYAFCVFTALYEFVSVFQANYRGSSLCFMINSPIYIYTHVQCFTIEARVEN